MSEESMVERVARALWEARSDDERAWEEVSPGERKVTLRRARTAIAAHIAALSEAGYAIVPREPTEEMLQRGLAAWGGFAKSGNKLCAAYRAMIGAAPKETP